MKWFMKFILIKKASLKLMTFTTSMVLWLISLIELFAWTTKTIQSWMHPDPDGRRSVKVIDFSDIDHNVWTSLAVSSSFLHTILVRRKWQISTYNITRHECPCIPYNTHKYSLSYLSLHSSKTLKPSNRIWYGDCSSSLGSLPK